ncbi:MAG: penicillin-binding protein 2 [Bdellovibrionales bacterium GWB1_52_6]|nr:MAG: penicillin-binding protein 2 [Bdellovibrionales bacterium GWB1_52_6]OFZ06320.1 MAG: penicillin-binding protein 2 [Bdellovibrionales bacterium GWA1_52_35]HCM40071.1 penicillin-binding protein 2 [Bdellovibrionales bacterium]
MAFLGQEEQIREFQDRFRYVYAIVFIAGALLTSRLVYLQVLTGDKMRQYSEENRIKRVKITAPRGMIFDRDRTLLIDNRPAYDLEIIPQYLKESKQTVQVIGVLAKILRMPESKIYEILQKAKSQPSFMPVKIKTDLTRDEVATVESWKISMPGIDVREEIKRTNIYGDVAAHLLGYIGEVNATELPSFNKKGLKYKLGDNIGKFGLEQRLENILRGIDGEELKEVDALGRVKLGQGKGRVLDANSIKAAKPGKNLVLTIDQDLQLAAATAFGDKSGSVVAVDPNSGEILAMLSRPSFDPTEFSRGISSAQWNKLINNENHPLRDKTIQDHYSPGSVFKTVTAIAGLEEGVIDEKSTIRCTGSIRVGNRVYHCWQKHGHGELNVISALTQSCDVFFYRVSQKLKSVDDLAKWAFHLGLGAKTGINMSREVSGLIPTEEWKKKRFNQPWNPGETLSVAIGQSFVLTTALQLANMYAAIGNGGTVYRPFLVKAIESFDGNLLEQFKPEILGRHDLKPLTVELVKQGLWGVINSPRGTAYHQRIPGADFAGKTGTVQIMRLSADKIYQKCETFKFRERHNGVFVGFAPLKDPQIAVAVIGEHVCHGSTGAAPIARAIIKTYLEKKFPDLYSEKAVAARLKGVPLNPPPVAVERDEEDIIIDNDSIPSVPIAPPPLPPLPEGIEKDSSELDD